MLAAQLTGNYAPCAVSIYPFWEDFSSMHILPLFMLAIWMGIARISSMHCDYLLEDTFMELELIAVF
jgi:hypothetical protein